MNCFKLNELFVLFLFAIEISSRVTLRGFDPRDLGSARSFGRRSQTTFVTNQNEILQYSRYELKYFLITVKWSRPELGKLNAVMIDFFKYYSCAIDF